MIEQVIKKFDVKKITAQLKKINKDNNKPVEAGIQIVINNMLVYNHLVEDIDFKQTKTLYLIYQMSSTITNMLDKFNIFPDKKALKELEKEDSFTELKKTVIGKK